MAISWRWIPPIPERSFGFQNDFLTWTPNGGQQWFAENDPILHQHPLVTDVRNTNPVQVVTTGHPFRTGDNVVMSGVTRRRRRIANGASVVTRVDNFIFTLNGKNGVAAVPIHARAR